MTRHETRFRQTLQFFGRDIGSLQAAELNQTGLLGDGSEAKSIRACKF